MKKSLLLATALLSLTFGYSQSKNASTKSGKKAAPKASATAVTKASANSAVVATAATTEAAAGEATAAKPPIEFTESKFSFGKVPQGTPVTHYFTFKNTSSTPVVIESATAQCGCTTPEYPKSAVTKGTTEKIKVTYNAAAMGAFTKQVTIRVAKFSEPIVLTIDGEVIPKEDIKGEGK